MARRAGRDLFHGADTAEAAGGDGVEGRRARSCRAVGSICGCYTAQDDLGFLLAKVVFETRGGNAANVWGPRTSAACADNDGLLHAEALRGKTLYFATASGMPDATERARVDFLPTGLHNWDHFGRFIAPMRNTLMPALV